MIKSKFAAFKTSRASETCLDKARLDCRVAKERIYTRSLFMAFIRIRSPNKAPPVFLFDGSTETIAICLSSKSIKKRRTNSSTKEDLPEPPVPVIPRTGTSFFTDSSRTCFNTSAYFSGKFSAAEIACAITFLSLA